MEQGISCSRSPIDVQICFHHLPFALSVSWSLSESSFNVKFCAGVTSSRTSFIASLVTATFVVYVEKFASASTSDCIPRASHTIAGSSTSPTSPCTCNSHPLAALWLFFSLMHFHLSWPNPLSTVHFVKLLYYWETRKPHNYTRCCLYVRRATGVQWPTVTSKLWEKWLRWLRLTHIYYLCSVCAQEN